MPDERRFREGLQDSLEVLGEATAPCAFACEVVKLLEVNEDWHAKVGSERIDAAQFGTVGRDVKLPAGEWLVYLGNGNGRAERNSAVTVGSYDAKNLTVVSR